MYRISRIPTIISHGIVNDDFVFSSMNARTRRDDPYYTNKTTSAGEHEENVRTPPSDPVNTFPDSRILKYYNNISFTRKKKKMISRRACVTGKNVRLGGIK